MLRCRRTRARNSLEAAERSRYPVMKVLATLAMVAAASAGALILPTSAQAREVYRRPAVLYRYGYSPAPYNYAYACDPYNYNCPATTYVVPVYRAPAYREYAPARPRYEHERRDREFGRRR